MIRWYLRSIIVGCPGVGVWIWLSDYQGGEERVTSSYLMPHQRPHVINTSNIWPLEWKLELMRFHSVLTLTVWASIGIIAIISCRNETCLKCAAPLSWLLTPHDTKRRIQRERLSEYRRKQLLSPSLYWVTPLSGAVLHTALHCLHRDTGHQRRLLTPSTYTILGWIGHVFWRPAARASTSSAGGEQRGPGRRGHKIFLTTSLILTELMSSTARCSSAAGWQQMSWLQDHNLRHRHSRSLTSPPCYPLSPWSPQSALSTQSSYI